MVKKKQDKGFRPLASSSGLYSFRYIKNLFVLNRIFFQSES